MSTEPTMQTLLDAILSFKEETGNNFKSVKEELATVTSAISDLTERVVAIEETQSTLAYEIELLKQKGLSNNICIAGIEAEESENLAEIVTKIASTIGIVCEQEDIIDTYRTAGQWIIARFHTDAIKFGLLKAKKEKKSLIVDELGLNLDGGTNEIFINHHLTPFFANLLFLARKAVKRNELSAAWFTNKGICVKRTDKDTQHTLIKSIDELNTLLPTSSKSDSSKRRASSEIERDQQKKTKTPASNSANSAKNRTTRQKVAK